MIFRRHRQSRERVGTFEWTDPPVGPPPTERVLSEGLMIAESSVRMAVKNRLLLSALRDRLPYDADAMAAAARDEFIAIARENHSTADRIDGDPTPTATEARRRRPQLQRMLGSVLSDAADDPEIIARVVDGARTDAWDELAHELTARLHRVPQSEDDGYLTGLEGRIRQLVTIDLSNLDIEAAERAILREWNEQPDQ